MNACICQASCDFEDGSIIIHIYSYMKKLIVSYHISSTLIIIKKCLSIRVW